MWASAAVIIMIRLAGGLISYRLLVDGVCIFNLKDTLDVKYSILAAEGDVYVEERY